MIILENSIQNTSYKTFTTEEVLVFSKNLKLKNINHSLTVYILIENSID